jgi:HK97 family phage portal protein
MLVRELRASMENINNPQIPLGQALATYFRDTLLTDSGIPVSEESALQVATVFACVQLVSNAMAALPLQVYERTYTQRGRLPGKLIAESHPLYYLLAEEPNEEMSSFTFRKTLQAHYMLWGNAYIEIQRDNNNRPVAFWPRNPNLTSPYRPVGDQRVTVNTPIGLKYINIPKNKLVYKTTEGTSASSVNPEQQVSGGPERVILAKDMVHMPGLSIDGRLGLRTVKLARQVVGLALAAELHESSFFRNGAFPGVAISHPATLSKEAQDRLEKKWEWLASGRRAFKAIVLEENMTLKTVTSSAVDSQLLESREFQRIEICSFWSVPPHMVGDPEKSNRANTEQLGGEFVTYTMQPPAKLWEQEINRKVFPATGPTAGKFFAGFDLRSLIFADAASRTQFYSSGHQSGYFSINDTRVAEGLNPIDEPWADICWVQINMQDAATAAIDPGQGPGLATRGDPTGAATGDSQDQQDPGKQKPADGKLGTRFVKAYSRLFNDAFGRITARSTADPDAFKRAFLPIFQTIGDQLYIVAAHEGRGTVPNGVEPVSLKFLADYIEAMRTRFDEWKSANGNADEISEKELFRAVRAISIEVFRNAAVNRAKELTGGNAQ